MRGKVCFNRIVIISWNQRTCVCQSTCIRNLLSQSHPCTSGPVLYIYIYIYKANIHATGCSAFSQVQTISILKLVFFYIKGNDLDELLKKMMLFIWQYTKTMQ